MDIFLMSSAVILQISQENVRAKDVFNKVVDLLV